MAKVKKIRFPLEMENGIMVRTLEELKEHFSLEKILMYISNGKLQVWLKDRYLNDIAELILQLNQEDDDYEKKVCNIFEVKYDEKSDVDLESAMEKQRKVSLLKTYTDDEKFLNYIDQMAFEQDDLYELLDAGVTTIYLCGERFSIPISKKGIHYIGVNTPIGVIASKEKADFDEKEISFKEAINFLEKDIVHENIMFKEKYQSVLQEDKKESTIDGDIYDDNTYTNEMLPEELKQNAEKYYRSVANSVENLNMQEIEADELMKYLLSVDFEKIGKNYR